MNYLIVGGTSTIGKILINSLVRQEHTCYVISRSDPERSHPSVKSLKMNILEEEIPEDYLPQVLDGMVYLPGNINLKPFRALSAEAFREAYEINFIGSVKSIQAAEKSLKRSENASIVLFSTVAVKTGMPFHSAIASAKGAVEGLARSLAAEFAPKVRVNTIALSLTDTKMANRFLDSESKMKAMEERHPMKQIGDPNDVSVLVEFLLSKNAKWITGETIRADGGIGTLKV
ncbi:MAG: SDR family oxidoreductase [Bacteroidales bacterium]|nr:SDR family oxidoreductase [Bacteroidales bacterium]